MLWVQAPLAIYITNWVSAVKPITKINRFSKSSVKILKSFETLKRGGGNTGLSCHGSLSRADLVGIFTACIKMHGVVGFGLVLFYAIFFFNYVVEFVLKRTLL